FLEADADRTASHAALLDDLVIDVDGGRRRKREANALIAAAASDNCGVDADNLTSQVNQGTAGVARIDGCIGLQEAVELGTRAADAAAILRAIYACGYGRVKSEGAADGEHPVADVHAIGVAELGGWEFLPCFNLDDGEICVLVNADHFRGELGGIAIELHLNL